MRILGQTLKKLGPVCFFIVYLVIALPPTLGLNLAMAEILLQDDFENAATSNTIWTFKNLSAFGVVLDSSKAHSGKGVLQLRYDPGTNGPGFEVISLPRRVPEVYIRWYEKYSAGWIWSGVAQKAIFLNRQAIPYGMLVGTSWGNDTYDIDFDGFDPMGGDARQNVGTPTKLGDSQWHCLEWRVRAGTGGVLQLWIDDKLKMDYAIDFPFNENEGFMLSAYYNAGGSTPNGVPQLQYRWVDDLVVSTGRIGCLPDAGDKTPPSVPKGLNLINP